MFQFVQNNFSICYEIKTRPETYEQHNNADAFAPFYCHIERNNPNILIRYKL